MQLKDTLNWWNGSYNEKYDVKIIEQFWNICNVSAA